MQKTTRLALILGLVLGSGPALRADPLQSGYDEGLTIVGKYKGRQRELPDVGSERLVSQLMEHWHFENCRELAGDSAGKPIVNNRGSHPEFDPMLVKREAAGDGTGRAVDFSIHDMAYHYSLTRPQPDFQGKGIQKWEGLTIVEGQLGYFGAGTPAWMTYEEDKSGRSLKATFTIQVEGQDLDGTEVIDYQKYSSDGRMTSLEVKRINSQSLSYRSIAACGDAFGYYVSPDFQPAKDPELKKLQFDELKAANKAIYDGDRRPAGWR